LVKDALLKLPTDHAVFADASADRLFLGRDERGPLFAAELRDGVPEGGIPESLDAFLDDTEQTNPAVADLGMFAELRAVMIALSPRDAELAATARALHCWHASHRFCSNCGAASDFTMAGWQRDCPMCGRKHFPRTDPVVIMLITRGDQVLLGRSPHWPEGMYSLLAGFVEPGETMEAAVRREVFEEAGVRVGAVGYLASQPWPFPNSLMFGCLGVATTEEITVDPAELEDARWVSKDELTRAFAGEHDLIRPAREGAIARFLLDHWLSDTLDGA